MTVIAIDGPAGSGKSTLARSLAAELALPYVNTGLMYRALTAEALQRGISPDDGESLVTAFARMTFATSEGTPPVLTIDGVVPGQELASEPVEAAVSQVSKHPLVREAMRREQRRLGGLGAVMEGRDIGTVVYPDADVKIFLVANPDERAARRVAERGGDADLAQELAARDAKDARVNPFVPPEGAVVIDTTPNTAAQTLAQALDAVRAKLGPDA